jgi:hypothetical protein
MAFVQSSYTNDIPVGYAGMVANQETSNRITRQVEDAAGIAYGRAAFQGANARGITGTPSANFIGFTMATYSGGSVTFPSTNTDPVYAQLASAGVLEKGVIWVNSTTAATARGAVYVTPAGAVSNSATGNTALPANVTFDDTITAAGLVRVRIK